MSDERGAPLPDEPLPPVLYGDFDRTQRTNTAGVARVLSIATGEDRVLEDPTRTATDGLTTPAPPPTKASGPGHQRSLLRELGGFVRYFIRGKN